MKTMLAGTILAAMLAVQASAGDQPRQIFVTGEGTVAATPDMATLSLGVTNEAGQAGEAMAATSDAVERILRGLAGSGVDPKDVQTRQFSLNPVWSQQASGDGRSRISGYVASNSVSVRVRDLEHLGRVLDTAIASGANDFNGLQFSVQEPDRLVEDARKAAVADAGARAAQLATAAGVTLGPVISITEQGGGMPQPMMMEAAMARSGAPVASGEVSISVSVSMVFAIAE